MLCHLVVIVSLCTRSNILVRWFLLNQMAMLHFRELILNIIKEGKIVPSEITVELIRKAMESSDAKRVLIDGFPRCEENRIAFERIVSSVSLLLYRYRVSN